VLIIAKVFFPLNNCENLWMLRLALQLDPRVIFPSRKMMNEEILLMIVEKCLDEYVTQFFDVTPTTTTTFDL
jgi:hypothetical protein